MTSMPAVCDIPEELLALDADLRAAVTLQYNGQVEAAYNRLLEIADRGPIAAICQRQLAQIDFVAGRHERAIARAQRAVILAPNQPYFMETLANILEFSGHIPESLDVALQLGCAWQTRIDFPRADMVYRRMLSIDARRYAAWANLGSVFALQGEIEIAARHFYCAVALAARVTPLIDRLCQFLQDRPLVQGLQLAQNLPPEGEPTGVVEKVSDILTSLGKAMSDLGDVEASIACHQLAVELRPVYDLAHWNLSLALLSDRQYEEGWREYEWRWLREPTHDPRRLLPIQRWRGQSPQGKRIMIFAEQGYGDSIQFSPLIDRIAEQAERVIVQVHKPLVRLFEHNFCSDKIKVMSLPEHPDMIGTDEPLDYFVPLMSLPHFLGLVFHEIPLRSRPMIVASETLAQWKEKLKARGMQHGKRIGIAWAGQTKHTNDANRSLPKEHLAALLATEGVTWVSLQKGAREGELLELAPGADDPSAQLTDFADTAALIAQLDLVISVDTAVVHLAGRVGTPVWVMLPFAPDWRWGTPEHPVDSWYPQLRLFRQQLRGDWKGVVAEIKAALLAVE